MWRMIACRSRTNVCRRRDADQGRPWPRTSSYRSEQSGAETPGVVTTEASPVRAADSRPGRRRAVRRRSRGRCSSLFLEAYDIKALQHPNRSRRARVPGGHNPERSLVGEERLPVDGVCDDDLRARERRIQLGEREQHLITVTRTREHVCGTGIPGYIATERRPGTLEEFPDQHPLVLHGSTVLILDVYTRPRHCLEFGRRDREGSADVAGDTEGRCGRVLRRSLRVDER